MKKIVRSIAICLAALATGSVMTSCDKAQDIINEIINYIKGGETYVYAGKYSLTLYAGNPIQPVMSEPQEYDGTTVAVKVFNGTPATANLTLPTAEVIEAVAVGDKTVTNVTISDININGLQVDGTYLNNVDATNPQGSITVVENGQQVSYPLNGVSLTKEDKDGKEVSTIQITEEEIAIEKISLFFGNGEDAAYAVLVKFPLGKAVTTNQQ